MPWGMMQDPEFLVERHKTKTVTRPVASRQQSEMDVIAHRKGQEQRSTDTVKDFTKSADMLNLMMDAEDSEAVIGDLIEQVAKRSMKPKHARRWLRVQVYKIAANELLKWVAKAASAVRVGK